MMQKNLSVELYEVFSAHLKKEFALQEALRPSLQFNKVYSISINKFFPNMQFVILPEPEPYLDYYIPYGEYGPNARDSSHGRITVTGERIRLENYEGQWGLPFYPEDPERTKREQEAIGIHNQHVNAVLKAKGFIP